MIYSEGSCRERDGWKGGTPTPCGGRCMPYNDQVIGQHVSGVLAVGPGFDDAAHPCRLACATGRVSFSEGVPHLSCGSPSLAIHPFGPSEWRPSLGFAADQLTWDPSSGYFMSDSEKRTLVVIGPAGDPHRPVGPLHVHGGERCSDPPRPTGYSHR